MSSISRIFRPPAARRAYSSFFSSKPGGGRYFNSAKPPKTVVTAGSASKNNGGAVGSSTKASAKVEEPKGDALKANETESQAATGSSESLISSPDSSPLHHPSLPHPTISPKDFKLHQFFSLHRPLLLLETQSSVLESATVPFDAISKPPASYPPPPSQKAVTQVADEGDSAFDADADTAREVTRALMISRAGSIVDWENALRTLGLDVEQDRKDLQVQMAKEWNDVFMDSVKRKRRKKMKKHKLKKRRRLTRASRLKDR